MWVSRSPTRLSAAVPIFVVWLVVCSSSFALEITGTREFSAPQNDGTVTVTIQVDISTTGDESPPHGLIVREYLPADSNVKNANPAAGYYTKETGELAWFFYGRSGVTDKTITYTFTPSETGGSVDGHIRYSRETETVTVDIGPSPIPTPKPK